MKISLPEDYKKFIEAFGGGYFAFTVIYSVTAGSEWKKSIRL
ncbi:SMI1/KNR4 family protein [Paenibacillus sp. 19GGS1-52]|nr:SMI1/KNR4 family protein [Paenibacillus sp. 19GGS1-52]